jgi:hypothetical protein
VTLQNQSPEPQTGKVTLSFLNGDEEVIGKTTKSQQLKAREEKIVSGSIRLRASVAQQIATYDVSVEVE